jgi:hypothetical protein
LLKGESATAPTGSNLGGGTAAMGGGYRGQETAMANPNVPAPASSDAPQTIDADDPADLERWAKRLGVDVDAVRNAAIAVGPSSDAVTLRLRSARGAAD